MADVQMQIVVGDGFSSVLERFDRLLGVVDKISNDTSKSVDKLTSVVEKLGNSANGAGDSGRDAAAATEEFRESADKASASSVSFSDSLQKMFFAFQAIDRIVPIVKQAIEDVSEPMRAIAEFGSKGGSQFNSFMNDAANRLGRVATDLNKAGRMWGRTGAGGADIEKLTELTDRFAKFRDDNSFSDVASIFDDAMKSKSVSGLAEMLGGGERIENRLKRAGVERALRTGDIKKALEIYERIADEVGMTKEKSDAFADTLDNKIGRAVNRLQNWAHDIVRTVMTKLMPIVNDILDSIESNEFQSALKTVLNIVGFVADKIALAYKWIKDVVSKNADVLEMAAAVAAIGGAIWGCRTAILAVNAATKANPVVLIVSAVVAGLVLIKRYIEDVTNTTVSAVDFIIGIVVGGVATIVACIADAGIGVWNFIKYVVEGIANFFITAFESVINGAIVFANLFCNAMDGLENALREGAEWLVNKIISGIEWLANKAISIVEDMRSAFYDFVSDIIGKFADCLSTLNAMSPVKINGLEEAVKDAERLQKAMKATANEKFDRVSISRLDLGRKERKDFDLIRFGRVGISMTDYINPAEFSANAIEKAIAMKNDMLGSVGDLFGGNDAAEEDSKNLSAIKRKTDLIAGAVTQQEDLRWMKELAEREFVSNVNVRTLAPNVKVEVNQTNARPQDIARALENSLTHMQAAGANTAHGVY